MKVLKLFISAGELSGDIHGGRLIKALLQRQPLLQISALGGDNMQDAGARLLYHIRDTSVMGFTEVIQHFPRLLRIWKQTLRHIDQLRPDLMVVIDYPGFNLRLAKAAHQRDIPVVYYISPQVWAWHQARVKKIRKYVREVLCILPFEAEWYQQQNVPATYVGHPLMDKYEPPDARGIGRRLKATDQPRHIGLFPGSRAQEISKHLPIMLSAMHRLRQIYPDLQATVALAPGLTAREYQHQNPAWLHWYTGENQRIMQTADFLVMSSGTASLEAVIQGTPFLVIYKIAPLTYWLSKRLVKVPYISLANLIAGEKGVTELIQDQATAPNIVQTVQHFYQNRTARERMQKFFKKVLQRLGSKGASQKAADILCNYLKT